MKDATIICCDCGLRVTGRLRDGKLYASRWPKADAPVIIGRCMGCEEGHAGGEEERT